MLKTLSSLQNSDKNDQGQNGFRFLSLNDDLIVQTCFICQVQMWGTSDLIIIRANIICKCVNDQMYLPN